MLWREASTPVAKVDQATGEIEGIDVPRAEWQPCSWSRAKLGMRSAYFAAIFGSNPSSPMTTTRFTFALVFPRR